MKKITPTDTLAEYERRAARLLKACDKKSMERAVRLLASYVAHYQLRHGMISAPDLASMHSIKPGAAQIAARMEALRVLTAALALGTAVKTPAKTVS